MCDSTGEGECVPAFECKSKRERFVCDCAKYKSFGKLALQEASIFCAAEINDKGPRRNLMQNSPADRHSREKRQSKPLKNPGRGCL